VHCPVSSLAMSSPAILTPPQCHLVPMVHTNLLLSLPGGIIITRICWFVRSLVRSLVPDDRSHFSKCPRKKTKSPIFMKLGTDVQHMCNFSMLIFHRLKL